MTRFWNAYGTVVTHVRSYNATGNAAAERVMRYLNKVLRQLTDAQYREWPEYLSTAAAVWNSTVTDTIGMSPAEADTGLPMRSPTGSLFQRPPGAPTTASRSELAVLQQSAKAMAKHAVDVQSLAKQKAANRLNAAGKRHTFAVGDLCLIYVPPTAAAAQRRNRKVKHMEWYRGPCTVMSKDSNTGYTVEYRDKQPNGLVRVRTYMRTIGNMQPYRSKPGRCPSRQSAGSPPAPVSSAGATTAAPTTGPFVADTEDFRVGELIAAKDDPTEDFWWLQRVVQVTGSFIMCHLYGTSGKNIQIAKFKALYTVDGGVSYHQPRHVAGAPASEWVHRINTAGIPTQVIARHLLLNVSGTLTVACRRMLVDPAHMARHGTVTHANSNDL